MSFLKSFRRLMAALGLALVAGAGVAHADKPATYTEILNPAAAGGYDVVSFFSGTPARGVAEFTATHNGATWRFANAANRARFIAAPAQYAPQYGGYCAWAVSQGYTAPGRPQHWRVVDGKLYFNYDARIQQRWERDIPGFIASANGNWPNVLKR
jgi:YHS domain-containing protein